ncbi:MAG: ADP-ribosylglycohydrolase family protein, partial [Anaerovoracaceae bacterium]
TFAEITAAVTHNHEEGMKGAKATAGAIFLARQGRDKGEIKQYIEETYQYDLSRSCDALRPNYLPAVSCQETVPQGITAFLEGSSVEEAIRLAVSLGGDTDTLGAIAGSIAEAYYPIPKALKEQALAMLDERLRTILIEYDQFIMSL